MAGVSGWVRNHWDGRVEAVFEGPEEQVAALVDWCRHGPPRAHVVSVQVVEERPESLGSFTVRGSD
jgi:acylphosphatase